MNSKEELTNTLERAEQRGLIAELKSFSKFDCRIIQFVRNRQDILLSFICGFIANLPMSVLFNIISLDIADFNYQWGMPVYLSVYIVCMIVTGALTVVSFQFAIMYSKVVSEKTNLPDIVEACILKDKNNVYKSENIGKRRWKPFVKFLKSKIIWFIILCAVSVLLIIILAVLNFYI